MFGNLISNRQLRHLIKTNELQIDPFDDSSLKTTHYTLKPGRIFLRQKDRTWQQVQSFKDDNSDFSMSPGAYVVIEPRETVRVNAAGLVGRFIPTSTLIEAGLGLFAGQIDNKYGKKGEGLRFGLKNLLDVPNQVSRNLRLAHVEFFDLRGIAPDAVVLTKEEIDQRVRRLVRAMDDGVNYEDDGE